VEDDDWEENPFENRPAGKDAARKKASKEPTNAPPPPPDIDEDNPFERGIEPAGRGSIDDDINPFENRPSANSLAHEYSDDLLDIDEFDKSKLAFVSGIGFVSLGFIFYFFVIVPGNILLLGLSTLTILISILVAFFYLLDDLKIRTTSLTERGARFISGIFFMVLVILIFMPILISWPNTKDIDMAIPFTLIPIIVLTHGSVALFLYSMLWEE